VFYARDPDLPAVDDVAVAPAHRSRLDLRRVGAGTGLGDTHALQAQSAAGHLRQVALLLLGAAVAKQRAPVVNLAVAGAAVAAGAVDRFRDHVGFRQAQARAAVLLRDQRVHTTGLGECVKNGLGVAARGVDLAVVGVGEFGTQGAGRVANVLVGVAVHGSLLWPAS
jgi:hypothetical protein